MPPTLSSINTALVGRFSMRLCLTPGLQSNKTASLGCAPSLQNNKQQILHCVFTGGCQGQGARTHGIASPCLTPRLQSNKKAKFSLGFFVGGCQGQDRAHVHTELQASVSHLACRVTKKQTFHWLLVGGCQEQGARIHGGQRPPNYAVLNTNDFITASFDVKRSMEHLYWGCRRVPRTGRTYTWREAPPGWSCCWVSVEPSGPRCSPASWGSLGPARPPSWTCWQAERPVRGFRCCSNRQMRHVVSPVGW